MKSIKVIVTGGTFDKEYDEINGRLYFKNTHVSEMLNLAKSRLSISVEVLIMKDSLDLTDADRKLIHQACLSSQEDRILITHGTDTMEQTAKYLGSRPIAKTILLTGAMKPYAFGSSDGLFNLGSALAFCQVLTEGVYVVMNGKYFQWNNVRKNRVTGDFETTED